MTLPNGIDGISEAIGTLFGVTGPVTEIVGQQTWGSSPISGLNTLTQDAVTDLLETNIIRNSPGWNAASGAMYDGLTPGIPYTLALIEQFVSQVTGLPLGTWDTTNEALLALEGIASNKDLQANWTTIFTDLGLPDAAGLATYISNLSTDISEAGVGNWGALLADLGLSGVPDLATFLDNSYTYGNTANTNFNTLLTGLAQGSSTALATYLAAAQADATAAQNNWNTLLADVSQASASAFASWVATAQSNAAASATNFANLLTGMGLGSIASLVTSLTGTASTASSASTTASSASTAAGTANTNIANLLSGMGLGSIASLVTSLLGTGTTASNANTTANTTNTWWTDLMTALGLGGGGSKGTAVGGAISSAASTASSASTSAGTANSNISSLLSGMGLGSIASLVTSLLGTNTTASNASTNVNSTWSWLFGTTTPTSSNQVIATKVANVLGGSSLAADVSSVNGVATTANSGQTTANNNISSLLTGMGLGSIASLVSSLLGTSSTASSASTTASTANTTANTGNTWWNQLMSTLGVANGTAVGTAVSSASSAASTASSNASTALTNAAAAATSASTAQDTAQGAIDASVQALTGSMATGAAAAAAKAAQQAIPIANITPPQNPSATGIPIHGASGTWGAGTVNPSGASSLTVTGSHTQATLDNWIGFWIIYSVTGIGIEAPYNAGIAASFGSLVLPVIDDATIFHSGSQGWVLAYVGAIIPSSFSPPSAQTCTVQITAESGYVVYGVAAVSDSYSGVQGIDIGADTGGIQGTTGSAPAQAGVTSSASDLVIQAFASANAFSTVSLTSYNKTQRANPSLSSQGGAGVDLISGDAAGASSVSFSASTSATGAYFAAIAINLVGAGTTPIGSVFKTARVSTATVNGSTGVNVMPTSFWPTPSVHTSDFTWNPSTGTLTCVNAGTYTFAVGILEAAVTTVHFLRAAIFHQGAVEAQGGVTQVTSTVAGTWCQAVSDTFYCNVGDTIQAGYFLSTAVTNVFTGESTGSLSYFSAALANRGTLS